MSYSRIKPIIHSLAAYEAAKRPICERNFSHQAKKATLELTKDITTSILELIKPARNEEIYQLRIEEYNSNPDVQIQVGNTLFNNAERLRNLSRITIEEQVFSTLDRIFKLPTEDYKTKDEFKSLDSSELDSSLTQLTRTIMTKPLIESYLKPEQNEIKQELVDEYDISNLKVDVIANLGELGLITLQDELKNSVREVYADDIEGSRDKLDNLLKTIKYYNPSSVSDKVINKKLLLEIFMNELERGNSREVRREKKNDSICILEKVAEILGQFNLDLDSAFMEKFQNDIEPFRGKSRLKILEAMSKTKITGHTNSARFIADQMLKALISTNSKGDSKFFASQFLVNNPNLISTNIIEQLIKTLGIPEDELKSPKSDTVFCSVAILDSLAKEERFKDPIKKLIIQRIQQVLSRQDLNEDFENLSFYLLVLAPLLDSPKILIDIYARYHNHFDDENLYYLAATISRFKKDSSYIDSRILEMNETKREPLEFALDTIQGIINNGSSVVEPWEPFMLSRLHTLANSSIQDLIQQSINTKTPTFGMLRAVMQDEQARTMLIEYLNKSKSDEGTLNILITTLLTRLLDISEYQSQYSIDAEVATFITKFVSCPLNEDQERLATINDLFNFYGRLIDDESGRSLLPSIEKDLEKGFVTMGKAVEPHLLKIVQNAKQSPDDIILQRQAELAENVLRSRRYLPELVT